MGSKMKISKFKQCSLEIIAPHLIKVYEELLIPKFSDISKPAFKSILINPEQENPFLKEDWNHLYVNEIKLYGNSLKVFDSLKDILPKQQADKKEVLDIVAEAFLDKFKEIAEESLSEENIPTDFDLQDKEDILFVQISIAQFYNSLSIIQNNKRINDLIREFLVNGKERNLIKAVKVDPSVLKIPEVIKQLDQLDPIKRNSLDTKIQTAKTIPSLTPDKRKKYILLSVYLNIASSLGYLKPKYPITNPMLQRLAEKLELIPETFNPDDFKKLATYYRKI